MISRPDASVLAAAGLVVAGAAVAATAPLTVAVAAPLGVAVSLAGGGWLMAAALRCQRQTVDMLRLLDGQPEAVIAVTGGRVVHAANAAARALFGDAPPLPGRPLEDLLQGAAEAPSLLHLGTERNGVRDCVGRGPTGEEVALEVCARPLSGDLTILSFRDASQRHLADGTLRRKLRELENNTRLLREIETLACIGCYDYYPASDEALWSRELEHIFGLDADPATPIRSFDAFLERVHPDDLPDILADAEDQTWREKERTFRIIRPDGQERHIFSKGYREFGSDGRVTRLFGIDQDITDRIAAEAALRESEETLRRLFETAPAALSVSDVETGRLLAVNRSARALFDLGDEDIGALWAADFHANSTDRPAILAAVRATGHMPPREIAMRSRKGRTVWVEVSCSSIPYRGHAALLSGFVDISARRLAAAALTEAQDRLRGLLQSVPLPLVVMRLCDGRILFCNAAAAHYLGVPQEDAVGLGAVGFFADREEFDRVMALLRRHRRLLNHEMRIFEDGDGARWASTSAVALEFDGEDAAVAIGVDITERRRAQDFLARAKAEAEDLARAKSEFMAVMSHEIRTPLSGILGMVQLLAGTRLSKSQAGYVDTIQRAGDTLLRLVGDSLDVERLEAGSLTLESADFRPREHIQRLADLMRPGALAKRLDLTVSVADDVPEVLHGDETRITQVLFHLVSNALKVTERGIVAVRLRTLGAAPEGGLRVQFSVTDNGPGIPEELQGRLFERFALADGSASRRHGGAGLGLALAKGLVTAMGGRIGHDPAPAGGTTFWVTLDLGEGQEASAATPDAAEDPARDALRVLLVEDDKINRMLTVELLRRAGHRVKAASDGLDGVAAAAEGRFDLILMDLHMPGIDGAEAIRRIRALPDPAAARVPIVVLTADITDSGQRAAREAGADTVVAKPFRMDVLNRVAADLLGRAPAPSPALAARAPAQAVPAPARAAVPVERPRDTLPPLDPHLVPPDSLIVRQWDDLGPAAVRGLVDLFRTTTPPRLEALEAAMHAGDASAVVEEAHALKGAAGVLGLTPLHHLYQEVEGDALAGDLDAVGITLKAVRQTHAATLEALAAFDVGAV